MNAAVFEALDDVGSAYRRWSEVNDQLVAEMSAAATLEAGPPVGVMSSEFDARVAVARAAIAFARACPADGPELEGVRNAAFALAIYQAVTPELEADLDELVQAWERWLPTVARWTPASRELPPPRPQSPAHNNVLTAVSSWQEAEHDRLHGDVVTLLTQVGGRQVDTSFRIDEDGRTIESSHITFSASSDPGTRPGAGERFRQWLGARRRR